MISRAHWEQDKIHELAESVREAGEMTPIAILNSYLPKGFGFVHTLGTHGKFERFDAQLLHESGECLFKIELEYGKNQSSWDDKMPDQYTWPRGLSLLARKNYAASDFFVKISPTYKSGFCVDLKWFREQVESGRLQPAKSAHSLNMVTCDEFYAIPWKLVREARGKHIEFFEDGDWESILRFMIFLLPEPQ